MNTLFKDTLFLAFLFYSSAAFASGVNFNSTTQQPLTPNPSGNIGIGSASPGQALDVQGTVRTTGFTMSGQTPISGYVLTASDSSGDTTWTSPGTVGGWTVSGINVYETSSGNVGIGTSTVNQGALVVTNGNVGIGTWVPADTFQVGKFSSISSGFEVDSNGNVGIGTTITSNASLSIMSGNVGIGTWVAAGTLDVEGGTAAAGKPGSNINIVAQNGGSGGQNGGNIYLNPGSKTGGGIAGSVEVGNVANFIVQGQEIENNYNGTANIGNQDNNAGNATLFFGGDSSTSFASIESTGVAGTSDYINFLVGNSGGTEAMRIVDSGNIGIGSLVPGQRLDVQGTVRAIGFTMSGQTPVSGFVLTSSDSNGDATWTAAGVSSGWTVSGTNVYETGGGNVGIGTSSVTQGALLVTNGNVGIGTWAPVKPLSVIGDTYLKGNIGIGTTFVGGTGEATLSVLNGNVGIGTWVPSSSLYVLTSATNNQDVLALQSSYTTNEFTGPAISFAQNFNGTMSTLVRLRGIASTAGDNMGALTFEINGAGSGTATTTRMILDNNGNLGIGTVAPGSLLQVNGNAAIGYSPGTAGPSNGLAVSGNVGIGTTGFNAGLSVMNGNVGIGTWAPTEQLEVVKSVSAGVGPIIRLTNNAGSAGDIGRLDFNDVGIDRGYLSFVVTPGGPGYLTWSSLDLSNQIDEKFRIDPNGNVGIGTFTTANPTSKLGVAGNIGIGTNSSSRYVAVNSPGAGSMIVEKNVGIGTWLSANQLDVNGAQAIGFAYAGYSAAPSNGLIVQGNVSIGTRLSANQLDVNGAQAIGFIYAGYSAAPANGLIVQGNVGIGTLVPAGVFQINSPSTNPFIVTPGGNVGIGTTGFNAGLSVMSGNVGIGTYNPVQALEVNGEIIPDVQYDYPGSFGPLADTNGYLYVPEELLDGNNSPGVNGYCLTSEGPGGQVAWAPCSGGNVGIGTGTPSAPFNSVQFNDANNFGGSSNFVFNGTNVGIGTSISKNLLDIAGDVSIGTSYAGHITAPANGIIVQGNVDIGTFASVNNLSVLGGMGIGSATYANTPAPADGLIVQGNVGIGTWTLANNLSVVGSMSIGSAAYANTTASANGLNVQGNVGIGSLLPGQALDVQGTVRAIGFTMSGQTPIGGYILTAADGNGDSTWSSPATVSGWTVSGNNVYETNSGNVGIGTSTVNQGALVVTNGNVGIGTWAPVTPFQINGSSQNLYVASSGNLGIGIAAPTAPLQIGIDGAPDVLLGSGSATDDYLSFSGGRAMVGFDSAAFTNGAIALSTGTNRGVEMFVGGTNGTFLSGTLALAILNTGDVGIGTTTPQTALAVMKGNVGIGTWTAAGGSLIVKGGGNVGIGSAWPGQALDVQGTVRSIGFTMSGQTPVSGYVLTANDSNGDATWSSAGGIEGWTVSGSNVYTTTSTNNVGIGTSTPQGGFVVTNGNVGVGTWAPGKLFQVGAGSNAMTVDINGNVSAGLNGSVFAAAGQTYISYNGLELLGGGVFFSSTNGSTQYGTLTAPAVNVISAASNLGIGTTLSKNRLDVQGSVGIGTAYAGYTAAPANGLLVEGNVGIGSTAPGQALDVTGTVRALGLTMSGQTPVSGYVLTASDSNGDATWTSPGSASGWTVSGNNVYETSSGNVGIGTSFGNAALAVMNGSVGIGTWNPMAGLSIKNIGLPYFYVSNTSSGDTFVITNNGNVGIGSAAPGQKIDVQGTIRDIGAIVNGNVGIGTFANQIALAVTNGNVGIGTWTAAGGSLIINGGGNVGIGSAWPGMALDVQGTVRAIGFTMSGQTPVSGYVLTANDINGDATWSPAGGIEGWTVSGANVYTTMGSNNVGIGTSTPQGGFVVTNGNVGIGTWVPGAIMSIPSLKANSGTRYLCIDTNGNVLSSATACSGT